MTALRALAAGSLRAVWPALIDRFTLQTGLKVTTDFAPAGMLRQRIEQGEPCDLFASANHQHPLTLQQQGLAQQVELFAFNALCLTVKRDVVTENDNWLSLLLRDDLRLATSTPEYDPSGDYTWQLFQHIEQCHPGGGAHLQQKARALVGGPHSLSLPPGSLAAEWLIEHHHAEMFIGYASYAPRLMQVRSLKVLTIPAPYNVRAEYSWAQCTDNAAPLAAFLLSAPAQALLQQHGFLPRHASA